jgi:hypothetical protein
VDIVQHYLGLNSNFMEKYFYISHLQLHFLSISLLIIYLDDYF